MVVEVSHTSDEPPHVLDLGADVSWMFWSLFHSVDI